MNHTAAFALLLLSSIASASAAPVRPSDVTVIDGDTIQAHGRTIRLVGFDTPERTRARCEQERQLGERAEARLRQIVSGGGLELRLIPCSCRTGTEGTPTCNHGRVCGILWAHGRELGAILISERLARPYVCAARSCPRRESWCG
jgi:micrococcal nuclease